MKYHLDGFTIKDHADNRIALVFSDDWPDKRIARACDIVQRCNSYQILLEACERIKNDMELLHTKPYLIESYGIVSRALAKAKGEE